MGVRSEGVEANRKGSIGDTFLDMTFNFLGPKIHIQRTRTHELYF